MDMSTVRSFRDLEVWRAAMDLVIGIHGFARTLPPEYRFELASQLRRAAVSIPSNVAEGHAQRSDRLFLRHVRIALGSLAELETQLEIATRLNLFDPTSSMLSDQVTRQWQLLHGTRRTLMKAIAIDDKKSRS
jgi:four helix bundle protein